MHVSHLEENQFHLKACNTVEERVLIIRFTFHTIAVGLHWYLVSLYPDVAVVHGQSWRGIMRFPRRGSVWVRLKREENWWCCYRFLGYFSHTYVCTPSLGAGLAKHGQVTVMMGSCAVCSRQQKKTTKKRTHTVQVSRVFVLPLYFFRIISIPFFLIFSICSETTLPVKHSPWPRAHVNYVVELDESSTTEPG